MMKNMCGDEFFSRPYGTPISYSFRPGTEVPGYFDSVPEGRLLAATRPVFSKRATYGI
jgi:hypothetical protein